MPEVRITRELDATREEVFRAWTDPEELASWYGPEAFDTPSDRIAIDLREGGRYELTMVRRDGGAEFPVVYEIVDLVEPELLVLRADMGPGGQVTTRVELEDLGGRTRMTLTDGPYPDAAPAGAGWDAAFDKLAVRLAR